MKEGNVLFNDELNTFYLRLYEGRKEMFYLTTHSRLFIYGYMASDIMVKYHSNSERKPAAATWATLSD